MNRTRRYIIRNNRNNFTGILTDAEAFEFGNLMSSVSGDNAAGIVRINYVKGNSKIVGNYLRRFGSKFPYSALTFYSGYIYYDAKKGNYGSNRAAGKALTAELQKVIDFAYKQRIQLEKDANAASNIGTGASLGLVTGLSSVTVSDSGLGISSGITTGSGSATGLGTGTDKPKSDSSDMMNYVLIALAVGLCLVFLFIKK